MSTMHRRQIRILEAIDECGPQTVSSLCVLLAQMMTREPVAHAVRELHRVGYVRRWRDGREYRYDLTEVGRSALALVAAATERGQ